MLINFVDDGSVVASQELDSIDSLTDLQVPFHYQLAKGVSLEQFQKADDVVTVPVVHQLQDLEDESTKRQVIRRIVLKNGSESKTIKQVVTIQRAGQQDLVTGQKKYGRWTLGVWPEFQAPEKLGLVAQPPLIKKVTVTPEMNDQLVVINYDKRPVVFHVNYRQGSTLIYSQVIAGKFGESVMFTPQVPQNWQLVPGQDLPRKLSLNDGSQDFNLQIEHKTVDISERFHDQLKRVKKVRSISYVDPYTKDLRHMDQTVELSETMQIDLVTNRTFKEPFETGHFDSVDVPVFRGYSSNQKEIPGLDVDYNDVIDPVTIVYHAKDRERKIIFEDMHGNEISSKVIKSKTDNPVKLHLTVPSGWQLTNGQKLPDRFNFNHDEKDTDYTVILEHHMINITNLEDYRDSVEDVVTRTIHIQFPNQRTVARTQEVLLTRSGRKDMVTGHIDYGDWSTGQFEPYTIVPVKGYTPNMNVVPAMDVDHSTGDVDVDVKYVPDSQELVVNYQDLDGNTVTSQTVHGVTGQKMELSYDIPSDWHIIPMQTLPREVTFGTDQLEPITVKIDHDVLDVSGDPEYRSQAQQTIKRVIHFDLPRGHEDDITQLNAEHSIVQSVTIYRRVEFDRVTKGMKFGPWSRASFDAVTIPQIDGYSSDKNLINEEMITADMPNQTIVVNYQPVVHQVVINYLDTNMQLIKKQMITAKTDETVAIEYQLPDGWAPDEHSKMAMSLTQVTMGPVGLSPINIILHHQVEDVTDPALTSKTVRRVVEIDKPLENSKHGVDHQVKSQTVKLTRSVKRDLVTHELIYGDWSTGSWAGFKVPDVLGYLPSTIDLPTVDVTAETDDQNIKVTYQSQVRQLHVVYYNPAGEIEKQQNLTAKTGDIVHLTSLVPMNWQLVPVDQFEKRLDYIFKKAQDVSSSINKISEMANDQPMAKDPLSGLLGDQPTEPTSSQADQVLADLNSYGNIFNDDDDDSTEIDTDTVKAVDPKLQRDNWYQSIPASYRMTGQPIQYINLLIEHATQDITAVDDHATINVTREVVFKMPMQDGSIHEQTVTQHVQLRRKAEMDLVLREPVYGKWNSDYFDSVSVKSVPGFKADLPIVSRQLVDDSNYQQLDGSKVTVNYQPKEQSQVINFVDAKGSKITSQTVTGHTYEWKNVELDIPDNWQLVNAGMKKMQRIQLMVDPDPVAVKIKHVTDEITDSVDKSETEKTMQRIITVDDPLLDTPKVIKQTATLKRQAFKDLVTNSVTYGKWSTGHFEGVSLKPLKGYVTVPDVVSEAVVHGDDDDVQRITVKYRLKDQTRKINYVDNATGEIVDSTVLKGKTDQVVSFKPELPKHWKFVNPEDVPSTVHMLDESTRPFNLSIEHQRVDVTDEQDSDKVNKTLVRTIILHQPDGDVTKRQSVTLYRKAIHDLVLDEVQMSDWSESSWSEFKIPAVPGYHTDRTVVNEEALDGNSTNRTVEVEYVASDQQVMINYVDSQGQPVDSQLATGKTGQSKQVVLQVPENYKLATDGHNKDLIKIDRDTKKYVIGVTFGTHRQDLKINLLHQMKDVSDTDPHAKVKIVRRIRLIADDTGDLGVKTQIVTFNRTAMKDLVTDRVRYGKWQSDHPVFDAWKVPEHEGYTPGLMEVPKHEVNPDFDTDTSPVVRYYPK